VLVYIHNKMKRVILYLSILILSFKGYSQKISVSNDTVRFEGKDTTFVVVNKKIKTITDTIGIKDGNFNNEKVYNIWTGEKLTPEEYNNILKRNSRLYMGRFYNEKGEVIMNFIDPDSVDKIPPISYNKKPENGEIFPEFEFKTIDNEKLRLSDLMGKTVILRCELFVGDYRLRKEEIEDLEDRINNLKNKSEIAFIIIFGSSREEIISFKDLENSSSIIVPDGHGFFGRNHIKRYPSTLIIDKDGRLIDTYSRLKDIDIEKLIEK